MNIATYLFRARIFKLLRSPRIDSKESIPPAYVAWRAGTPILLLLGSQPHKIVKNSSTALYQNPYRHLLRYRGTENLLSLGLHNAQYTLKRAGRPKQTDTKRKQEGRKQKERQRIRKTGNQEDRKSGRQEIRKTGNQEDRKLGRPAGVKPTSKLWQKFLYN